MIVYTATLKLDEHSLSKRHPHMTSLPGPETPFYPHYITQLMLVPQGGKPKEEATFV